MEEQNVRSENGGKFTFTVIYAVASLLCLVGGLLLNSFGLFADGALTVMILSSVAKGNGRPVLSRTLCIGATVLGIYVAAVGFFKVSALIGYAGSSASIYVYPLFALIIILKVAGMLFCEGEDVRSHTLFSLGVTALVVIGTLLLTAGHYFEPAVACALGVYTLYLGVITLFTNKEKSSENNTEAEDTSSDE